MQVSYIEFEITSGVNNRNSKDAYRFLKNGNLEIYLLTDQLEIIKSKTKFSKSRDIYTIRVDNLQRNRIVDKVFLFFKGYGQYNKPITLIYAIVGEYNTKYDTVKLDSPQIDINL